jgi:hypothetical protein
MSVSHVTEEDVREEVGNFFRSRGQSFDEMRVAWMPGNETWIFEARFDNTVMSGRNVVVIGSKPFGFPTNRGLKIEEVTVRSSLLFAGHAWIAIWPPAHAALSSLETEQLTDIVRQLTEFYRRDAEAPRSPLAM